MASARTTISAEASDHPIAAATGATVVASAIFLAWPQIDTGAAGLFHALGDGFPVSRVPLFIALRDAGRDLTTICVVGLVIACIARLVLPRLLAWLKPSVLTFLVVSLAVGPGLIVNRILKEFWGRARPLDTDLFGGQHAFSPAWEIADGCIRNCSFVSGEASAGIWLVAFAFVVPVAWRPITIRLALAWAILISFNRMAFGGHYFSDVVIGWGVTMIVVLICRELILVRQAEPIDSGAVSAALLARARAAWRRIRPERGSRDLS